MRQGSRDITSGGTLLVASVTLYLLIPGQVETLEGDTLTPASMPMAITLFIAMLSSVLVFSGLRQRTRDTSSSPLVPDGGGKYLGLTVVVMVSYVGLIPWVGFIPATAAALLALALLFGNRDWKVIFLMVLLAPPGILLFFRYSMLVLLPQGTLFD